MPDKPTVEQCIAAAEMRSSRAYFARQNGGTKSQRHLDIADATLAILRDYARLKAMLDDPRVVRVPLGLRLKMGIDVSQAEAQVAAWDKEHAR